MQIRSFALRYSSANHRVMTLAFLFICCLSLAGFSLAANRVSVKRDIGRAFAPIVVSGDPAHNDVALTFDDGPNPDATPQILRELEHAHTHATFFVVGRLAERYPQLIAHMVRDGDAIENHSWAHEYTVVELPSAFRHALEHADNVIEEAGAEHPRYFRPPYGVHAPWTLEEARADGENVVLWSVPLSDDWDQPGTQVIVQRTLAYVKPGCDYGASRRGTRARCAPVQAIATVAKRLLPRRSLFAPYCDVRCTR